MKRELNPGDVVLVVFPYGDKAADKVHPALVLEADDQTVYLAYGTSARVDQASRLNSTVCMMDPEDLAFASLHKPTAFHLDRRARVSRKKVMARLGALPVHKHMQLYRAAVAAGLLRG